MTTIDDYLAGLEPAARNSLGKLRDAIRKAAPHATEGKSYGLPAFIQDGPLVAFAAHRGHCAFYPLSPAVIEAHKAELEGYELSKGTIRFAPGEALPAALVKKLVKARLAEKAGKARPRTPRKKRG
ncbi:MAG: DUF1801 domain-containing protein [Planctomycetota bacterium]|nr:DUF1801 domain-containing protein [Planctomycetota bacterium]